MASEEGASTSPPRSGQFWTTAGNRRTPPSVWSLDRLRRRKAATAVYETREMPWDFNRPMIARRLPVRLHSGREL